MWNYQEAIDWLYGTQLFGIKLGLDNVRKLLAAIDLEELPFEVVHVAGTNGKGSVCAMIERILRESGMTTGLFTSPHLVSFEERIEVSGKRISRDLVTSGLADLKKLVESWETHPTFFELTFALATKHFADSGVECAVLETGMGGRLDATNVVTPRVSVITPVTLDHQEWLGETLREIAGEKAGIIKPGVPVVSSPQHPDVIKVLHSKAVDSGSPLQFVDSPYEGPVGLPGRHQRENAAVARAATEAVPWNSPVGEAHIRRGLAAVAWPARFQRIDWKGRVLVIDGAHNPDAAASLASTWSQEFGEEVRACLVFAAVESKDVEGVLRPLLPIAERIVFAPLESSRGLPPAELEKIALQLGVPSRRLACAHSIESALASLPENATALVYGSLFLAGKVLELTSCSDGPGFQPSLQ